MERVFMAVGHLKILTGDVCTGRRSGSSLLLRYTSYLSLTFTYWNFTSANSSIRENACLF